MQMDLRTVSITPLRHTFGHLARRMGADKPASRYLEVKDADGAFYYELGHITADAFDMFYTARGNNLGYVRVE